MYFFAINVVKYSNTLTNDNLINKLKKPWTKLKLLNKRLIIGPIR